MVGGGDHWRDVDGVGRLVLKMLLVIMLGHSLTHLGIKEVVNNGPGNDRLPVFLEEHVTRGVDGEEAVDHPHSAQLL